LRFGNRKKKTLSSKKKRKKNVFFVKRVLRKSRSIPKEKHWLLEGFGI